MKLRCYCCGEPIKGQVALATMSPDTVDRVFVVKIDHIERLDIFIGMFAVLAVVMHF